MTIRINKSHLKQELLNPPVLIGSVVIASLYILFSTLIINYQLLIETIMGSYSFESKLAIIFALTKGVKLLYNPFELSLVFMLGFLMGINLILITKSLRDKKKQTGSWSMGLGMAGFIATSGCASCGITLLSVLGPTVSLSLLPFQAVLLQLISLALLMFSLIHTLNRRSAACILIR